MQTFLKYLIQNNFPSKISLDEPFIKMLSLVLNIIGPTILLEKNPLLRVIKRVSTCISFMMVEIQTTHTLTTQGENYNTTHSSSKQRTEPVYPDIALQSTHE
jgi:hypothetical protein